MADIGNTYRTRGWLNGRYWGFLTNEQNDEAKIAYVLGIMDGINISHGFSKEDEKILQLSNLLQGVVPARVKRRIDGVFEDQSYGSIPIYIVMILLLRETKGQIADKELKSNLEELAQMYSK